MTKGMRVRVYSSDLIRIGHELLTLLGCWGHESESEVNEVSIIHTPLVELPYRHHLQYEDNRYQ